MIKYFFYPLLAYIGFVASRQKCAHEDKELREHLDEQQIDKMVEDSFPASDPPSTY